MKSAFAFQKNQQLLIDESEYLVLGGIEFYNQSDGSLWQEYCVKELRHNRIKWLSVDHVYQEYAIYTQHPYSRDFDESSILSHGYHKVDEGTALVRDYFGQVDTSPGESVFYQEYEDQTEEYIISIEQWSGKAEYSKGYYLDWNEVKPLQQAASHEKSNHRGTANRRPQRKVSTTIMPYILIGSFFLLLFILLFNKKPPIASYLKNSSSFSYKTSITSDLNNKEKADVYTTLLTVEEAAKAIISAIDGKTEDVQESDEDDSVAIMTDKEYCLVYTSTDEITMVQISDRAYVYQSTNAPYHSTGHTHSYYRRFYYIRGYSHDYQRYRSKTSGYEDYDGADIPTNYNDTYHTYSSSVRQSSLNSRTSSGGGISSGK